MQKIAFFLLILSPFCYGAEVALKAISLSGKSAYEILVGEFPHENNALQLKFKLASSIHQPISIDKTHKNNHFVVKIGPIKDQKTAVELQKKINDEIRLENSNTSSLKAQPSKSTSTTLTTSVTSSPSVNSTTSKGPSKAMDGADSINPTNSVDPINSSNTDLNEENTPADPASNTVSSTLIEASPPSTKLWNLHNADIRAVIGEMSRITGKNFLIDPRVQGKISITSSTPLSNKELYQVFLSMLQISGYAAIPSGPVTKIVPNVEAKATSPDELTQIQRSVQGDDVMISVIPIRYVPSEQLVPILRPLMPAWSNVAAYGPSNMLILSGRANNIKQMTRIIKQVDNSSVDGVDIIPLKHVLAMDIANTLKELVKSQSSFGNRAQTKLAVDDRGNSILLSGNKTERIRLRLLISKLDKAGPFGTDKNTKVIYLNYLRAEDLVPILAGVAQANFSGNVGTTIGSITRPELDSTNPASSLAYPSNGNQALTPNNSQSSRALESSPAATPTTSNVSTQNEGNTKPSVQIIAEPNTNSIILNAPSTLIRILSSVISQLDIRPAQLLIEALVVEIDEHDFTSLGIEWGSNDQTGNALIFRPGFAIVNSKTSWRDFQAQIYSLVQDRKANILSTPSVVVLDNRQAKILIGKQVSIATTSYPNNAGGTTTASPYSTFDRVNVALHLYVRPQITRGNGIQLQIDQGNDTLDLSSTLNPEFPIFKISSIVTAVHIENGDVVVLGGLTQDGLAAETKSLPVLGDIPGLGRLFQHNKQNREKRVLMVFIRPCILRTKEDNLFVSGSKYYNAREEQSAFLQTQPYDPRNKKTMLPPLDQAPLPRPFTRIPNSLATK